MISNTARSLTVFAPAKINLYLHITGRRDDGYHLLDSLTAFADIGDQIHVEPAQDFVLSIAGPYASAFTAKEQDASPDSSNLVVQAVWALARAAGKIPDTHITLTKNLPLASGLGGGSSDAATALWALMEWWGLPVNAPYMKKLMMDLGSDVPACFHCKSTRIQGIGDDLQPGPAMPEIPILLAHPGKACRTKNIFENFGGKFRSSTDMPEQFDTSGALADFLNDCHNDLTESALDSVPEIAVLLDSLRNQPGALIARMSGSGAACFALFAKEEEALDAAENLIGAHPEWWVRSGTLGRPERY